VEGKITGMAVLREDPQGKAEVIFLGEIRHKFGIKDRQRWESPREENVTTIKKPPCNAVCSMPMNLVWWIYPWDISFSMLSLKTPQY